jgi:2-dehydro-3-deoxygalactonokinase
VVDPTSVSMLALDWGTTSCRAYLMDGADAVCDVRTSSRGVMAVTADAAQTGRDRAAAYEHELDALCGDWLRGSPRVVMVACGMIGSDQGWTTAGYLDIPVDLLTAALPLAGVETRWGRLHIVPGLVRGGTLPDVIRGEETQILGALLAEPSADAARDARLIALPGTHTKWALLDSGRVRDFRTSLTGELFGLLLSHSILGRSSTPIDHIDWAAFDRGLEVAGGHDGEVGVLGTVFSTRALRLTGLLPPTGVADYLSGLLIGDDLRGVRPWLRAATPPVLLCGATGLNQRYARALTRLGVPSSVVDADATPRALAHIARQAGLLAEPNPNRGPSPTTTRSRG